jgi:cysteinyl-tRNA synthetase
MALVVLFQACSSFDLHAQSRPADPTDAGRRARLAAVQSWGFWLRFIDIATVQASAHDLLVLDFGIAANRRFVREFSPEEIAAMKLRTSPADAGKPPRILLAYLSIGEAERYRPYWRQEWYEPGKAPGWLGPANPQWDGNWLVRFWAPDWQRHIFGSAEAYLERILAQGFDGIYLDRADVYEEWRKERPGAEADMVAFVAQLAAHGRRLKPDLIVVMQNAEDLVRHKAVLSAIDGMGKEDLLYGIDHTENANKPEDVSWSRKHLDMALKAGRKILAVEYVSDPAKAADATRRLRAAGYVPYIAPRGLHCLNAPPGSTGRAAGYSC